MGTFHVETPAGGADSGLVSHTKWCDASSPSKSDEWMDVRTRQDALCLRMAMACTLPCHQEVRE